MTDQARRRVLLAVVGLTVTGVVLVVAAVLEPSPPDPAVAACHRTPGAALVPTTAVETVHAGIRGRIEVTVHGRSCVTPAGTVVATYGP